jgi:hypothetical protein
VTISIANPAPNHMATHPLSALAAISRKLQVGLTSRKVN